MNVLDRYLQNISRARDICVVVPSGNEANTGHHFSDRITEQGQTQDVEIRVGEGVAGFQLELWASVPDEFSIAVTSPGGENIPRVPAISRQGAEYSFVFDTALPTVGIKKRLRFKPSSFRTEQFLNTSMGISDCLYNHPSVCYYTILNEGWGQYRDAERIYRELKAQDPTRIYDTASGWFRVKESDVQSEHVYFKEIDLKVGKLPLVLSEFGGYSCKLEGHSFNLDKTYGYRTCETTERFEADLLSLYRTEILPAIGEGLCAAVLTQVSDVEDETNGLLTYDRRVTKVSALEMQKLAEELFQAFDQK